MTLIDVRSRSAANALCERLSGVSRRLSQSYLNAARETLSALVDDPEFIQDTKLERRAGGYARTLLFGDEEMSVWGMVWAPGSATSIHDHHCSCCFGIVRGSITETWFRPIDAQQVVVANEAIRAAGYVAAMQPTGPNIHQMRNDGGAEAISIHIYGFDHRTCENSILREYTLGNT